MYYPYLRGRQNELLALRELAFQDLLSQYVVPIIEPVKMTSTLVSTICQFNSQQRDLVFINNPKVGSFRSDVRNKKNTKSFDDFETIINNGSITKGWIVDEAATESIENNIRNGLDAANITCLCLKADNIRFLERIGYQGYKSVVPYAPAFRRIRGDKILLEDTFNKKARNADYSDDEDEFFSRNHLDYEAVGYVGFSDYSIIGEEYSESGFAPHAVAVHIVYLDQDKELRVHHFVSDDNDDIHDSAGKLYQALEKMVQWNYERRMDTLGIRKLEEIYRAQSYPGLGYIKRVSIMHHLELMSRFLDGSV